MTIRNIYRNVRPSLSLSPAARVTGTTNGSSVDLRGYDSAMVTVAFGAYTDGTHTPVVQESSDGTTFAAVAAADLDGSLTAVSSSAGANTIQRVGYSGSKRYIRVVMVVTGATTGALSSAVIMSGHAAQAPVV